MSKTKATHDTDRNSIQDFEQIINVGPATSKDFQLLGYQTPQELIGEDPARVYLRLCEVTQVRQDPCVLDVLMSAIDYMGGNPPRQWWDYTAARKQKYAQLYQ